MTTYSFEASFALSESTSSRRWLRGFIGGLLSALLLTCVGRAAEPIDLEAQFREPPAAANPWVFWYWMQGNVSREGITADLEAMKQANIGGAYLMPIQGPADPPLMDPPIRQLTPEFWAMVRHAMEEADRLGLEIGMHACDGFAVAGGPWITPELSMQRVVWTETNVIGGGPFEGVLEQPETNEGYYRDIAVLAFPSPDGAGVSTRTVVPMVSTSDGSDAAFLAEPGNTRGWRLDEPGWVQYEFDKPFTCRSIRIRPDGNNFQSRRLLVEVSDDGEVFRSLSRLEPPRHGWQDSGVPLTYAIEPVTARFFRFVFDDTGTEPGSEDLDTAKWPPRLRIDGVELFSAARIHQFEGKSARVWRIAPRTTADQVPDELCVPPHRIVKLTDRMDARGHLDWSVPEGRWTILRVGHTSTGQENETGGGGKGLECDKFNPEAIRLQFDRWFGEARRQVGPELAGRVLSVFHVDSWEAGSQNWSQVFREEFKRRRGYDLMPYLPAMAGIPVESADVSERFLYDVRQTVAELIVDQFYGTMRELAHETGTRFTGECTAPTMTGDGMLYFRELDLPMGEFWLRSPTHDKPNDMLDAISGAHVYGKPIVQAEAFTQLRIAWDEHPGMLKALGDRNYALGINRFVYHVFTHNPWLDRQPGMTLNGVGLYFQRDQTWWETGDSWVDYVRRCQALLQQGVPVVDVAVFTGEEVPRRAVLPERLVPTLPGIFGDEVVRSEAVRLANEGAPQRVMPEGVRHSANMADPEDWTDPLRGYAYDSINRDALLRLATVRNGRIELPDGASYALLVIPADRPMSPDAGLMSPEVAKRLRELIAGGATVLFAERPTTSPSLENYPQCDTELATVVEKFWPDGGAGNPKGLVVVGSYREDSFTPLGIDRDLFAMDENGSLARDIAWTHRRAGGTDIYFISNQREERRTLEVSLRAAGRLPEIWDPVTGEVRDAKRWRIESGRTVLPLRLEANGSVFLVLREATEKNLVQDGRNWIEPWPVRELTGPWRVRFVAQTGWEAKDLTFDSLTNWATHSDSQVRHYSGAAVYEQSFSWLEDPSDGERVWLDLGRVGSLAVVSLNGVKCGTAWTVPYRVEITSALESGQNELRIEVTNPWHNRLVYENELPVEQRHTWMNAPNRLQGKSLLSAGLMGPVRVIVEDG